MRERIEGIYPDFTEDDYIVSRPKVPNYAARRGPGGKNRPILDAERMTICMLRGKGLTEHEIGEKLGRPQQSINNVLRAAEKAAKAMGLNYDWRSDLKEKSIFALRNALTDKTDPYKAGALGKDTLKGLGEFEQEGAVNFAAMINAVPEGASGVERKLHMPPSVISQIAADANVKSLVLSHRMMRTLGKEDQTQAEIRKHYSGPLAFANDLDCFPVK